MVGDDYIPLSLQIERFGCGARGLLSVLGNNGLPVPIVRAFWISRVSPGAVRGGHAHRTTTQILVMLEGSAQVKMRGPASGGVREYAFRLSADRQGTPLVPPYHWLDLTEFSPDALLLVLVDMPYAEADYIRSRDEFDRIIADLARPVQRPQANP